MERLQTKIKNKSRKKIKKKKTNTLPELDYTALDINQEFRLAIDLVQNTEKNLFITGKAGSGKSTLLKLIKESTRKNFVALAPTGLAAVNVKGQTIHSFFKFPFDLLSEEKIKRHRDSRLLKNLELLIIDEISMVRADLMDAIDKSLRLNREIDEPFGGVQIVLLGDLFQLPPVVKGKDLEMYFNNIYNGPYFFNADVFEKCALGIIELKKIYRQIDKDFISDLNRIREKRIDDALITRINDKLSNNNQLEDGFIILTTTNANASLINDYELSKLDSEEYIFTASIQGKYSEDSFPTELELRLKVGGQVILVKNDKQKRWVNGTLAKISKLGEDSIWVDINGHQYKVERESWENVEYVYDEETETIKEKVVGVFSQYPLKLAWALTIHKSQGQTFDKALIDLGNGAFTHGQTYVALSRCRQTEGIVMSRPLRISDVIVDERVYEVYSKFEMIN